MITFKALAAAVLLAATAATPAFAQVPVSAGALYIKNCTTSGIIRRTTSIRTGP